jgi:xanthine dehydrogenase accessory factor
MNFSLLDKIDAVDRGILATILNTEGHTYKKRGARALFAEGAPAPVWGNLGSVCVDQELVRQGGEALAEGKPRQVVIDTSEAEDADFGYGTYCGGVMTVLVEPVLDAHKSVYRELRKRLGERKHSFLVHDLETGKLHIADSETESDDRFYVEAIPPLQPVHIFGATPLTHRLVRCFEEMEYEVHVIDWRKDYLDGFENVYGVTPHLDELPFDADAFVLIQSHHFHRDKAVLEDALARKCAFVGMLSSRVRRDQMYQELEGDGVPAEDLARVSCPLGLDLGGRSDAEIAIAIAAQLVEWARK